MLVEEPGLATLAILSSGALSLLHSLFWMRASPKKWAFSTSISLALSICISGLRLVRPSSGQESTWMAQEQVDGVTPPA
jgi:hypothetical protein